MEPKVEKYFKDKDVLRRFNVTAAKGKKWLPEDYGFKPFDALESGIDFESEKEYHIHSSGTDFVLPNNQLLLE